jgi:hypothetical protein
MVCKFVTEIDTRVRDTTYLASRWTHGASSQTLTASSPSALGSRRHACARSENGHESSWPVWPFFGSRRLSCSCWWPAWTARTSHLGPGEEVEWRRVARASVGVDTGQRVTAQTADADKEGGRASWALP